MHQPYQRARLGISGGKLAVLLLAAFNCHLEGQVVSVAVTGKITDFETTARFPTPLPLRNLGIQVSLNTLVHLSSEGGIGGVVTSPGGSLSAMFTDASTGTVVLQSLAGAQTGTVATGISRTGRNVVSENGYLALPNSSFTFNGGVQPFYVLTNWTNCPVDIFSAENKIISASLLDRCSSREMTFSSGAFFILLGGEGWAYAFTAVGDSCSVPSGEITAPAGWAPFAPDRTVYDFHQTLTSLTGIMFSGRSVRERDAGGGTDSCWWPGSMLPHAGQLTGGQWPIRPDNTWGDPADPALPGFDSVGGNEPWVKYYRDQNRAPCQVMKTQQMQISCPDGSWRDYGPVNLVIHKITATTVSRSRAGVTASRRW